MRRLTIHKTKVEKIGNKLFNTVSFIVKSDKDKDIERHLSENSPYSKYYFSFLKITT